MESLSIDKLKILHPLIRQDAIDAYLESVAKTPVGCHPYITETYRSFEKQAEYYAQGRTKPGAIITHAKPGQSYHQYYLALDFVLLIDGSESWIVDKNWLIVVDCFKKYGFEWGGDFPTNKEDYPHFEKRLGYIWEDLLILYNNKDFISGTEYLNL
jgi:peptidoglycan L-alanyl-D-glutamate endopeptidase CwlK